MQRVASCFVLLLMNTAAFAGFTIEGSPASGSEWGDMGQRAPYEREANASFRVPDAKLVTQQARYKDAQLVVDLAYKAVTQRGSGQAENVEGFADDVPFSTAISMIMPTGWQLYQGKDLEERDVPEAVSYIGGKAWPDVLAQLGDRYALKFHVDWYDRTILMSKGRPSVVQQASRIRVIAEPVSEIKPSPVVKPALPAAKTFAAGASAPGVVGSTSSSSLPRPVVIPSAAVKPAATPTPVAAKPVVTKPVAVKPSMLSMQVRSGTLHENVIRLSKENGWEAPTWSIEGDYRIPASYNIQAKDFAEAMVKLLMIHPIEADVNTAQRKIYVLKEIR